MPANSSAYQKAYKGKHYAANKARYIANAAARKQALREEVWALKREPCTDCGESFNPWQMQFDHRDGAMKIDSITKLINRTSRRRVFEEIKKCDLVCANCHFERTYQRSHAGVV